MEILYTARVIINEFYDGADIIIPAKKDWFVVAFSGVWFCILLYFGIFISTQLLGAGAEGARVFVYVFFTILIIQGFSVTTKVWWIIAGKELIHVSQGVLTIDRKGAIFKQARSYELAQCSNFRAVEEERPILHYNARTAAMLRKKPNPGTIKFDYDVVDTIQFGDWLPEAEANYILDRLRAKKLID
jgi:hypothetical protein